MQHDRSDAQSVCAMNSHVFTKPKHSMVRRILKGAAFVAPLAVPALLFALPTLSHAQATGLPAFNTSPGPNGGTTYSLSVQTMLLLTMLTFLPAMVLMMTSFTRIIIVLSLLRQAIGTPTTPPNQVLVGLALFLTLDRKSVV